MPYWGEEIPSVPKLRAARDRARADFLVSVAAGVRAYSSQVAWERCERELQTAEWRLACESWRWARRSCFMPDDGGRINWIAQKLVDAWRYAGVVSRPGKGLVVRSKGAASE